MQSPPHSHGILSLTAAASREWATPPPPNNLWRAAELAAIEERRCRRNLCGSPGFCYLFTSTTPQVPAHQP